MAVLVCYLDDSGTDSAAPVLTMAGYVGTFTGWAFFEHDAKKVFADFGVGELHGKEFNATKGDFAKWPRIKKEAFAARLYWDLRKVVHFGVTASIKKATFAKAKSLGAHPNESPYGYCFRQILDQIMYSAVMKITAARGGTLSFVVEAGNKNDAGILRIFNEQKWSPRHTGVDKILKSVSFADKGSSVALQMADFLAFHARRFSAQCEGARKYLPLSDLQKVIFYSIPTAVCRTNFKQTKKLKREPLTHKGGAQSRHGCHDRAWQLFLNPFPLRMPCRIDRTPRSAGAPVCTNRRPRI